MNKFPRSAYIHIPFCHRRCFYCDFAVIPLGNKVETLKGYGSKTVKEYLYFLYKEILSIKHKSPLSTIYVGGGTPSILDPTQIKELIDLFKENYGIDYGAEITMEVDPASFTQDDLFGFINAGINRFSLGVQSFNNQILQKSGRRHSKEDAEKSCLWLKREFDSGLIKSWSLDLIQNLPLSGFKEWQDDLKKAITFSPPHISIYDLNIENGTVFKKLVNLGKLKINVKSADQKVEELSGGQRQAVAIARSTAFNAKVVIMDEPTAALAIKEVGKVLDLINSLKKTGVGVIVISHRMDDIFSVCDRVMALFQGTNFAESELSNTSRDEVIGWIMGKK